MTNPMLADLYTRLDTEKKEAARFRGLSKECEVRTAQIIRQIATVEAGGPVATIPWVDGRLSLVVYHDACWCLTDHSTSMVALDAKVAHAAVMAAAALVPPTAEARVTDAVVSKAANAHNKAASFSASHVGMRAALTAVLPDLVAGLRPTGGQRVWRDPHIGGQWCDVSYLQPRIPVEYGTVYPDPPEGTP